MKEELRTFCALCGHFKPPGERTAERPSDVAYLGASVHTITPESGKTVATRRTPETCTSRFGKKPYPFINCISAPRLIQNSNRGCGKLIAQSRKLTKIRQLAGLGLSSSLA